MRTLYLLRHAKARRERDLTDRDRQLHRNGIRQGAALAAYFAKLGKPVDRILCSPSRRTRDTLALVLPALPNSPELVISWRAVLRAGGVTVVAHHDSPLRRSSARTRPRESRFLRAAPAAW